MPRKNLIRTDRFPYHVTARTNNREAFPIALNFIWAIATEELYFLSLLYDIEVNAFVAMPNHFHLLITTPKDDLGKIMNTFMRNVAKRTNSLSGRTGHLFGGPYFWTLITSTRYFGHAMKYVYRNPVKAQLCEKVEEYEFSTASGIIGNATLPFPIHYTRLGLELNIPDPDDPNRWLDWLNRPFPVEAEKLIQKCLRRQKIKELIKRTTRRPHDELSQLL